VGLLRRMSCAEICWASSVEPHWHLATAVLVTGVAGERVGKPLLDRAIRQPDVIDLVTPMCLESLLAGKKAYVKNGIVPWGKRAIC
jgi:hypothetical protein